MMDRRDFLRTAGGAAGGAAATATVGTAAAAEEEGGGGGGTERPVFPDYVSDAKDAGYEDLRGQDSVTIEVGADPEGNAFAPTRAWLSPGTEITFEWVSNGHNVVPHERPDGASWEPHEPLEDSGFSYSTTVEAGGMHTYFCQPHEGLGMKGVFAVGDDVETESDGGEGGGPVDPEHMGVPFHPHYVGVSTVVMMVVSIMFTFFLLKYGESPHASGGNN